MSKWSESDRGFKFGKKNTDLDGQEYRVSESSLATHPAIRVYIDTEMEENNLCLHLSIEQAHRLACELHDLCLRHYQVQAIPESEAPDG